MSKVKERKSRFMSSEPKILTRDVKASVVPIGTKVTLQKVSRRITAGMSEFPAQETRQS